MAIRSANIRRRDKLITLPWADSDEQQGQAAGGGQSHQAIALLLEILRGELSSEAAARVKAELCATYALAEHWVEAGRLARELLETRIHPLILIVRRVDLEVAALLRTGDTSGALQLIELFSRSAGDSSRDQAILVRSKQLLADATQ